MRTDSLGNTYVTDDNGNQTSYRTDSLGNTYGSDGSMSRTDSLGNTYVTDGNGNQTQYRTDSLGNTYGSDGSSGLTAWEILTVINTTNKKGPSGPLSYLRIITA